MKALIKQVFFLVFVLCFGIEANAQIIYTDVNPDVTVDEFLQGYPLDFNDDDKVDVHVTLQNNVGVWVMLLIPDSSVDNTYVVYNMVGEEASVLEFGDEIAPNSNLGQLGDDWYGLMYGYWDSDGEFGNWVGTQEDKYIGIKFEIGSNFHYGWIHLTTHQYSHTEFNFTLKGFAYNTVADELILTGDTGNGVGIEEITNSTISVYPNPTAGLVFFEGINNLKQIALFDFAGKMIQKINVNQFNKSVDLSNLTKGIYMLRFETTEGIFLKRIIKE